MRTSAVGSKGRWLFITWRPAGSIDEEAYERREERCMSQGLTEGGGRNSYRIQLRYKHIISNAATITEDTGNDPPL